MDRVAFGVPRLAQMSVDERALRDIAVLLNRLIQLHYWSVMLGHAGRIWVKLSEAQILVQIFQLLLFSVTKKGKTALEISVTQQVLFIVFLHFDTYLLERKRSGKC